MPQSTKEFFAGIICLQENRDLDGLILHEYYHSGP